MRLTCPLCGPRDRREFYYYGADDWLARPAADAAPDAWHDYVHLRDNPAGPTVDLWYHEQGCGQWLRVRRDTVTHAVHAVDLVMPAVPARGGDAPPPARAKRKTKGDGDAA
ncbi:MAG: sarcosine oxidase subunit delta [Paracoccaceae bacterium]|nr:MAG: sarcosine oxidase subunit delta [Paracoccaceae bacterium]